MGKLRIAQIGVGYWGPNLLRNFNANNGCEVIYVADLSENRRQYVESKYPNIVTLSSPDKIFDDQSIDAVVIATPADTHHALGMQALSSGKHVLVEKPMARTALEVEELGLLARKNKLTAMVGHTFVYNPAVRALKKVIDSGELGQVRYIYSQRLNLGRIRSDIDALWNFAPHDVSIVQYLFGDPKPISIKRSGMDYVQPGIEDVVFLNITYPNRVMVNIHVSWLDPNRCRKMVVVGSNKMVVYDDTAQDKITIFDKGIDRMAVLGEGMDYDNFGDFSFAHRSGSSQTVEIEEGEPLKLEVEHFVDCIKNGTPCLTGAEHALRVVEILENSTKTETQIHEVPGELGVRRKVFTGMAESNSSKQDRTSRG